MQKASLMCLFALAVGGLAYGQEPETSSNRITGIGPSSPPGSVLVLRSGSVYSLGVGDTIFEGDRIFTRGNGTVRFTYEGCEVALDEEEAVGLVSRFDCDNVAIASLPPGAVTSGIALGTAALGAASVGGSASAAASAPMVLPPVFASVVGGAAVASTKSGPASP